MFALLLLLALPQASAPPPSPSFEVASLKLNKTDSDVQARLADGEVHIRSLPLVAMVMIAWNIGAGQVSGAPAWMNSDRYDLAAKAGHPAAAAAGAAAAAEIRLMLRNLLSERFHMAVHMTQVEQRAYVLTLEPGGGAKPGSAMPASQAAVPYEGCVPNGARADGMIDLACTGTIEQLAFSLPFIAPSYFDHATIDQTGLTGVYKVELQFVPAGSQTTGPTLFDALRRAGLRVQDKKVMLPTLVIDHIDRTPTEN